jgi:dihydrofolate synthase/folylpolyglutamate synthase
MNQTHKDTLLNSALTQALKRFEKLITRDAESLDDPQERQAEFQRRLERTRRLMAFLGDPQDRLDMIHIGGTSGKGSVAMMCEAILHASGARVGTHTSPYLQTPLEKVRVDGELAAAEEVIALTDTVMDGVGQLQAGAAYLGAPHYAEAWLGLALRHFADRGCKIGAVEVGMGGRFDCTNIVTPRVSVISTVHYDHTRVLGDTLAQIAYHKAGIIKPGVPVVVGEAPAEAMAVIEEEATRNGARLIRVGQDIHYRPIQISECGGRFDYRGLGVSFDDLTVGLRGAHQIANAAVALAALEICAQACGIDLDERAIREALAGVRFAGRLEMAQREPRVVLDGAHNEEKVGALVAALGEIFSYERMIMVLGMLETKNAAPILDMLAAPADVIVTTAPRVKGKPAIPADRLARMVRKTRACEAVTGKDPLGALKQALSMAAPGDLVVVTGSLYLIGTVRSHWHTVDEIVEKRTMFPNG